MSLTLGLLPGDGIGPEIVESACAVTEAALVMHGVQVEWQRLPFGREAIDTHGTSLPEATMEALKGLEAWLLGPHDNAGYPPPFNTHAAPGGVIRKRFDLYANIRPARALSANIAALCPDMDVVIVRENTEGFYSDRNMFAGVGEFMPTADMALSVSLFTRAACERIAHTAFQLAMTRGQSVTIAHKANVLPMTTGLFRDCALEVAKEYPLVSVRTEHVDALAALLARHSAAFDVIVAENMFGDILSDLTGQLCGSLGIAPSLNSSQTQAMAQAAHGAAPDIAGKGVANPIAMILSAAMLLRWLADRHSRPVLKSAADAVANAVTAALDSGVLTPDLGGRASTNEFTMAVSNHISAQA
ncbi:isocitrate/isopropylmalate family dehydrogenase [soil metagenome]